MIQFRFDRLPAPAQWLLLTALSAAFAAVLQRAGLPAAFFLGPMAAGVAVGANGGTVRVPRLPYTAAQTIMGLFLASAITPGILRSFVQDWPVFLAVVVLILAAASTLGWTMARTGAMPASTSIWGSWPGGATAMIIMAEEFGADARLVAFMQYFRVACVAGLASVVAAAVGAHGSAIPAAPWFPPLHYQAFAATLLIAGASAALGHALRMPSGPMLLSLAIGAVLNVSGAVEFELPRWLLTGTYAALGWSVGLHFTPGILAHALRAFPKVLLNVALLIAFSAGVGFLLTWILGIDALTAYLATSPGGMDSVAIIAASSHVDLPFVIALQMVRFLTIIAIGPPVARFLARHAQGRRVL
ncbi:MAG: AbrB family transcriptional regulator [Rhodomicrobium sp.]